MSITDSGPQAPHTPPRSPRHFGRKVLALCGLGLAVIIAFAVGANAAAGHSGSPQGTRPSTSAPAPGGNASGLNAAPDITPAPAGDTPPPAPPVQQPTVAQQQALDSAQSYLDMGDGMSKAGLIKQLHSHYGEGFAKADAVWAADHVNVNWNHQAVLSAQSYLDMGDGMSREGLIEQLHSPYGEGFTLAQATYAADQVGL